MKKNLILSNDRLNCKIDEKNHSKIKAFLDVSLLVGEISSRIMTIKF